MFVKADNTGVKVGLTINIVHDMAANKRAAGSCSSTAMLEPIRFGGVVYAEASPSIKIVGQLEMLGVFYQVAGIEVLHLADMLLDVEFSPPAPFPTKIVAAGTVAIGRDCSPAALGLA